MLDPVTMAALIQAGGTAVSGISSMLGGRNAAKQARKYLEPIKGYNEPYMQQGHEAYSALRPQYMQMAQNPRQMYDEDVAGYQPSGAYNYKLPFLQREAKNAALSGGTLGTETDERRRMEMINALLNSDMGEYLNRIGGYRGMGIEGLERSAGRGFNAMENMSNIAGNRAGFEYGQGAQGSNNLSSIIQALSKIGAGYFGDKAGREAMNQGGGGYNANDYSRSQRTAQTQLGLPNYGGGF